MSELTLEIVLRSIFGTRSRPPVAAARRQSFDVVTKEQARNLQFAYKFR